MGRPAVIDEKVVAGFGLMFLLPVGAVLPADSER